MSNNGSIFEKANLTYSKSTHNQVHTNFFVADKLSVELVDDGVRLVGNVKIKIGDKVMTVAMTDRSAKAVADAVEQLLNNAKRGGE